MLRAGALLKAELTWIILVALVAMICGSAPIELTADTVAELGKVVDKANSQKYNVNVTIHLTSRVYKLKHGMEFDSPAWITIKGDSSSSTILDCGGAPTSAFAFSTRGGRVQLQGLTVRNCGGFDGEYSWAAVDFQLLGDGDGVTVLPATSIVLQDVVFVHNVVALNVTAAAVSLSLTNCSFTDNSADEHTADLMYELDTETMPWSQMGACTLYTDLQSGSIVTLDGVTVQNNGHQNREHPGTWFSTMGISCSTWLHDDNGVTISSLDLRGHSVIPADVPPTHCRVVVRNSTFHNNSASLISALRFSCDVSVAGCDLDVQDTTFTSNNLNQVCAEGCAGSMEFNAA